MRTLERIALFAGLVVVGVTVLYRNVLSDEQRAMAREMGNSLRSVTREVTDTISPLVSDAPTRADEEAEMEANRDRTAAQWEVLGY